MAMQSFMEAHRVFGGVETKPYQSTVSVAASAIEGKPVVSVHAEEHKGGRAGGLMDVEQALELIAALTQAIAHAEAVAVDQRHAMLPRLRAQVAAIEAETTT